MVNKTIAKSLRDILDHPIASASLDRSKSVDESIEQVLAMWRADLSKRHPAPAYIEDTDGTPIYQGTDMDLFTFLMALSQRQAVINIPKYELLRAAHLRSDQYVISKENRHGQLIRLTSNSTVHSFSGLIKDFNVVEIKEGVERVGLPRNFAMVDYYGQLYGGWERFEWRSSEEEDKFLREHKLEAYQDTIELENFVNPALAFSFYGSPYITAKILALRIKDQAAYYRKIAKELMEQGVQLPPTVEEEEPIEYWKEGETRPIKVKNLEAKLLLPDYKGEYPIYGIEEEPEPGKKPKVKLYDRMPTDLKDKIDVLRYSRWISNKLSYTYGPMVRTPVRAVELAFFLYGFKSPNKEEGTEIKPGWAVPPWNRNYKEGPRTRIKWNQLEFNPYVQLLYRIRETTMQTSAR